MKPPHLTTAGCVLLLCLLAGACQNPRLKARSALAQELRQRQAQQLASARHCRRGVEAYRGGEFAKARAHLEKAVTSDSRNANARMAFGVVAFELDDLALAADSFDRATRLEPTRFEPYFNMGVVMETVGDYEQAAAQYEKALELAPGQLHVMENLARCYLATGQNLVKARELVSHALRAERRPEWRLWLERHAGGASEQDWPGLRSSFGRTQ